MGEKAKKEFNEWKGSNIDAAIDILTKADHFLVIGIIKGDGQDEEGNDNDQISLIASDFVSQGSLTAIAVSHLKARVE